MKRYLSIAVALVLLTAGGVFAQQAGAAAGPRDLQDRGRGLPVQEQQPLRRLRGDAGGRDRHRSDRPWRGAVAEGRDQRRFNQPVRYVIYSHDTPITSPEVSLHRHGDRRRPRQRQGGHHRRAAADAVPNLTFSDDMIIELAAPSCISPTWQEPLRQLHRHAVPEGADPVRGGLHPVETLAFRDFPDGYINDWVESLRRVETMDFDVLALATARSARSTRRDVPRVSGRPAGRGAPLRP